MRRTEGADRRVLIAAAGLASLLALSCKETDTIFVTDDQSPAVITAKRSDSGGFYADDSAYIQRTSNFYFQVWDETFTKKLDELPERGEVPDANKPNSGGFYAEPNGGTNVRMVGGLSPLEKYDRAFNGGQSKAADWERKNHSSSVSWAGHCNGFSATAQRHPKEPSRSVVRGGVTFAPQDVKALLAEMYMNADFQFLGGERCEKDSPGSPATRTDPLVMGECEDLNPGTMHVALGNWLGRKQQTVIMDKSPNVQVWNFPVVRYQVLSINRNITAQQAQQYVTGGSGNYIYNPEAVRFAYVQMRVSYVNAVANEVLNQRTIKDDDLSYVLELNGNGEVIGGEWAKQSQSAHPDFLWVALEPMEPNGTRFMGNPFISNQEVLKMWAESVGYDPANPPPVLKRPVVSDDNWGKWPSFDVTLDGSSRGSVFGGKKVTMRINRRDTLAAAGVALDVFLNGKPLPTLTPSGTEPSLLYSFDALPGFNRLQLQWKKNATLIEDVYLRFHMVP